MLKPILKLFIMLFPFILFSQTEKDDYEIYNELIKANVDNNLDTIILIKKMKPDLVDFSSIEELVSDTLNENTIYPNYFLVTNDVEFLKRVFHQNQIKEVIKNLISDFQNHPIIEVEKLRLANTKLISISNKKYNSFFRGKHKKIDLGWKKIKSKYKSDFVIKFSKIKYVGSFASVYLEYSCGGLCGSKDFILMEKINNEWKVLKQLNIGMS